MFPLSEPAIRIVALRPPLAYGTFEIDYERPEMNLFAKSVVVGSECFIEYLPDGEAVLLNRSSEHYFGLDEMGVQMWRAVTSHSSIEDAFQELVTTYEVEPGRLRADLEALVTDLVSHELLEIAPE